MEHRHMNAFVFVCPSCGQRIKVNQPMRDAIVANGCPVCAFAVSGDDFTAD